MLNLKVVVTSSKTVNASRTPSQELYLRTYCEQKKIIYTCFDKLSSNNSRPLINRPPRIIAPLRQKCLK